ncbi:hypothetical protein Indivirus_4_29 [Indivirus ILV1]|uniref:Uncharacterized protein n=1 Tax=Indivirus ILV1 TaxID=1977633 RepID=A0A1V0SDR5_9VIRU|nr:hypothetical protein Indivirus_4_29 [Indivirus ILV1]
MTDNTKYVDHLDEDDRFPFPHAKNKSNLIESDYQNWYCVSFLSPEGIKNCSVRGLKVRGVFGTQEEANARAKEIQDSDPNFHVFVGEVGKWCPWDPDPNSVKDQEYQNKELNDLMKGYKDNLEKSKKMQKERKDDMLKKAAESESRNGDSNPHSGNKAKAKLQQKLEERRKVALQHNEMVTSYSEPPVMPLQMNTSTDNEVVSEGLKNEENIARSERQRLDELNKTINDKKQNIESIDSKLEKIKELYEKINSKKTNP